MHLTHAENLPDSPYNAHLISFEYFLRYFRIINNPISSRRHYRCPDEKLEQRSVPTMLSTILYKYRIQPHRLVRIHRMRNFCNTMSTSSTLNSTASSDFHSNWASDEVVEKVRVSEAVTKPWASLMIQHSGITSGDKDAHALDLACGTGVITATIYEMTPNEKWERIKVMGSDLNETMLSQLTKRAEAGGWPEIETKVMVGMDPSLPPDTFTHAFINMGIYLMSPDTLSIAFNKLGPGGFLGVSSLASIPWYKWVFDAASRLPNPSNMPPYEDVLNKMFSGQPWAEQQFMEKSLREAGFGRVNIVEEKKRVNCGTPPQCLDMLHMPVKLVASWWPEEERDNVAKKIETELYQMFSEELEDGNMWIEMHGFVGCAWKTST
ncbi:unnamed protein product [Periconia digitata]|uniref:Methyltransferase domain-containing protein n=1 Tax=Periconia digitata TaxID=1303443 RepID=A0A9W4XVR6_9PLEO|nr:unnamed protein product [Periconia digitata]